MTYLRVCDWNLSRSLGDTGPMSSPGTDEDRLGLADVLQQLGAELRDAGERGGSTLMWTTASVEIEVAIEATAGGGVKFWVLNAEASGSLSRTTKITVGLSPYGDAGLQPVGM